jgi:hypothetical protein
MNIETLILINLLLISLVANFYLFRKIKSAKPKLTQSIEVRDLLRDLVTGPALIKIERVDPGSVFIHSPRSL